MNKLVLFLSLAGILCGCVKNNPQPIWLNLSKWTLVANTDPNAQDHPTFLDHNFSDAWVYVDEKLVGVFELPCKIPVLTSAGSKNIRIYPTVRNNGIAATKKIYPFVTVFEQTFDLVEGQTYDINLVTKYYTETQFWLEEFADNSPDITATSGQILVENDPAIAISGKYGHIHLTGSANMFAAMTDAISLPKSGAEVYMELNYRQNVGLMTSLTAVSSDGSTKVNPNIMINAQTEMGWKKIYIDLRELVSYSVNAVSFRQAFDAMLDESAASGDIYIDNIRLVHF